MEHTFEDNICKVRLKLNKNNEQCSTEGMTKAAVKRVENIRNCDVYVADSSLLFFIDVQLFKLQLSQTIDLSELKILRINYDSKELIFQFQLPCLPTLLRASDGTLFISNEHEIHLWKFKRITDRCQLFINGANEPVPLESNFNYGFASKYSGKVCSGETDLSSICRVPAPQTTSPLKRSIDREIDEMRSFSCEQYKCDFVELQVPEGHENPMHYKFHYNDCQLTREEECVLHNLTKCSSEEEPSESNVCNNAEIDCGLINILMAICYDIRTTASEATCESGWTRCILSAVLSYFEPFSNMKATVISFLRRTIIYPLYRNYDFGRLCVDDTIKGLQSAHGRDWVLKQLLETHHIFMTGNCSREVLNRYYIEDYIRYVHGCSSEYLQTLSRNLKNILFDVYKKNLGLNLVSIESDLLQELITDMRTHDTSSDDYESELEFGDEEGDAEEGGDFFESSSSSDTEENSVIEQRLEVTKH